MSDGSSCAHVSVLCVISACEIRSLSDYAFPYIILVLSLVTLAVYMSASEIQVVLAVCSTGEGECSKHEKFQGQTEWAGGCHVTR